MKLFLRTILAVAFFIGVTSTAAEVAAPSSSTFTAGTTALAKIPRGGAGPLDADLVAKTASILQLVNGVFIYLAPEKVPSLYKFPTNDLNVFVTEGMGAQTAHYGLLITALKIYGQDLERATAIGAIPLLALSIKQILNGSNQKLGLPAATGFINAALSAGVVFGGLHQTKWMGDYLKVITYFMMANGIVGGLAPGLLCKLWGTKQEASKDTLMLVRSSLLFTLSIAMTLYVLMNGTKSIHFALGIGVIPHILQVLSILFVTKEADAFGMDKNALYFWIVVYGIIAGTLAL